MSKKIAIITDSAPLLKKDYIAKHNIYVLPLSVVFDEGSYKEDIEITHADFYKKMKESKNHPKTSQPSFGDQVELYKKLKEEGYDSAIAIHCSGTLSGTFQSALMAVEETGFPCEVIDSKIGAFPLQLLIEHAVELREKGSDYKEISESVKSLLDKTELYFIPASLEQLHKSGRVSGTASLLSNLLNIKLIISFDRIGAVHAIQKIRSDKKARGFIEEKVETAIKNGVNRFGVIHCNNESEALNWGNKLKEKYPNTTFEPIELSFAVGVHTGEGTVGISWINN